MLLLEWRHLQCLKLNKLTREGIWLMIPKMLTQATLTPKPSDVEIPIIYLWPHQNHLLNAIRIKLSRLLSTWLVLQKLLEILQLSTPIKTIIQVITRPGQLLKMLTLSTEGLQSWEEILLKLLMIQYHRFSSKRVNMNNKNCCISRDKMK